MHEGDRLTDLAREMMKRHGIRAVSQQEASAVIPARAAAAPAVQVPRQPAQPANPMPQPQRAYAAPAVSSAPSVPAAPKAPAAPAAPAVQSSGPVYDLVLVGGTCVIPEVGRMEANVCIQDGKIAALTTQVPDGKQVVDARGLFILPGIIDPHTHIGLAVPFEQELETESRSALLGGVTTIGTYFNQEGSYLPLMDRVERSVAALSRVDMIPHFTLRDETQLREMPLYSQRGMNSFKVYMCGVPGLYPHQEDGFIVQAMRRMRELRPWADPILSVHCENVSICDTATAERMHMPLDTLAQWNETHPNLAEGEAVMRTAYLSRQMDVRAYIVHSSTKEAMEVLRKEKHPRLLVETTSPYLALDTTSDIGAYGKMLPPIREPESRQALWDGIRSGLIDTIGTDNTVLTSSEKNVAGGMREAGAGYPTLATHLASVLSEGVFQQEILLETLVPLMTMNPAKIFGVYPRKGTLMPGSDADLVLVDLNRQHTVRPEELLSRSDFSLFQGKTLHGWPCATIKDGKIVAWQGRLVDDSVRGHVLRH